MNQEEEPKRNSRLSELTSALRRRKNDRFEIDGYHIGGIRSESPIAVLAGATLAGDVLAPEVEVWGLIYGYVACRRLRVAPGGQIWGDVYANSFELAPTGKGLCPFHDDQVPSLHVSDDKNFWWCFACEKGGGVIDFYMEMQKCDFKTALDELAEMLFDLPEDESVLEET